MRELLVVRHAKSAWNTTAPTDFERPLAKRGLKEAPRMGAWLAEKDLEPELVLTSPARRAEETVAHLLDGMGLDGVPILRIQGIYDATVGDLLGVLAGAPRSATRVMLVGHNPGLDGLVSYLSSVDPPTTATLKLMTTGAVAHLQLPEEWADLPPRSGTLVGLYRPREMLA